MAAPIRKTKFVPEWIDMTPNIPVPKIDWITNKQLDIAYGEDPLQKYDLYYLENPTDEPLPVVIIVHGGGFKYMDKRDWHMYPGFFAMQEGFAMVSMNYRLAPKVRHHQQLDDVIAAILHIKDHAKEYNIDPERLFLYGTSAGGSLVSMVGLKGHNENAPYAVKGIAALCPVISFTWFHETRKKTLYQRIMFPIMTKDALGKKPAKALEEMKIASAENYIGDTIPPFYLQSGTKDPAINFCDVQHFYDLLSKAKNATPDNLVIHCLEGSAHAGGGPDYLEPQNILPILDFFKKQK